MGITSTIRKAAGLLKAHHSRPSLVEQAEAKLLRQLGTPPDAMPKVNDGQAPENWCYYCSQYTKKTDKYCGRCGRPAGTYTANEEPAPWHTQSWAGLGAWQSANAWPGQQPPANPAAAERRQRSRRTPSPRARAKGKGRGQMGKDGKGKGDGKPMVAKGQPQDWPSLPPPPLPPSLPEPPPAVFPADSAASSAQSRLDALLTSLRSTKDQLPPEISSLLGEQELEETKSHSKAFHKAVSAQEKAKKELVKVQTARRNFLNAWGSYVEKLQLLMKQQLEDQEKALADFNQHEARWNQQLADANKELAALSALPGGTVQQVSSDSDMDAKPESPPEDPRGLDKASRLKDQQEELAAILFRAKEKAESASAEAEQRNTPPGGRIARRERPRARSRPLPRPRLESADQVEAGRQSAHMEALCNSGTRLRAAFHSTVSGGSAFPGTES